MSPSSLDFYIIIPGKWCCNKCISIYIAGNYAKVTTSYTIYIYIYGNDAVQRRNISTVSGLHIIQCVGKLRIHVPCFINTHTCANIYVSLPYKLCFNINKSIYIPYKMPTQTNTPKHSINVCDHAHKSSKGIVFVIHVSNVAKFSIWNPVLFTYIQKIIICLLECVKFVYYI